MYGKSAILEGGQELSAITNRDFNNGTLLQRIIDAVNSLALNSGTLAVGKLQPPPPVQSISVAGTLNPATNSHIANSEILHWTIGHTQAIQKNIRYFSEISTTPSFYQAHVIDHGTSRTGITTLPTYLNDGVTRQGFYLRSYAQYPGSDPQKPTVFGGAAGPTKILMNGGGAAVNGTVITTGSACTLLPSTGSGTAAADGSQSGQGLGTSLARSAPGPKRQAS
jgi:hypothetical protein